MWCLKDAEEKGEGGQERRCEKTEERDGMGTRHEPEPTTTSRVQIWSQDRLAVGCWVFLNGLDISCLSYSQNFGRDGTHSLGCLFNVSGIKVHNKSHSFPSRPSLFSAASEQETQKTQSQRRL